MSIKADIEVAKGKVEDHTARHKCSSLKPCRERAELWLEYMQIVARWGKEPDDSQRQRDHHFRNVKNAPPSTEAELAA